MVDTLTFKLVLGSFLLCVFSAFFFLVGNKTKIIYFPPGIDHFHKWRPLLHSFVFMLIRPTALILKQVFF